MALSKCCGIIINIIIIICAQIHEHMNLGFLRVEYVEALHHVEDAYPGSS